MRPLAGFAAGCILDTTSLHQTGTERRIQAILAAPAAVRAVHSVSAVEAVGAVEAVEAVEEEVA